MLNSLKSLIKQFIYRPRLARLGQDSFVLLPRQILCPAKTEIGDRVIIYGHSTISLLQNDQRKDRNAKIIIGDDVYVGRFCQLIALDTLTIGNGAVLSDYVYVNGASHGFNPEDGLIMQQPIASKGPVRIGQNCFLGFGVKVMPGVNLGDWCIVGAGSVVTKSFPPYSMIAGVPARLIRQYSSQAKSWVQPIPVVGSVQGGREQII